MKKIRVHPIDFVFVLLAVAVCLAVIHRAGEDKQTSAPTDEIYYTLTVSDIPRQASEAFGVGDAVYEEATGAEIGKIEQIIVTQSSEQKEDTALGTLYTEVYPDRCDVALKISASSVSSDGSYTAGSYEIKAGKHISVRTENACAYGICTSFDVLKRGGQ